MFIKDFIAKVVFRYNKFTVIPTIALSRILKGYTINLPISVTIETSSVCNLRCPLCPVHSLERKRKFIDPKMFTKIVLLTHRYVYEYVISMWGEPLIDKDFFCYLDVIKDFKRRVMFSTNLQYDKHVLEKLLAYEPYISEIVTSVDGYDKDSYSVYRRGGDFERLKENLSFLSKTKLNNRIIIQFLIGKHNMNHIEKMKGLVKNMGYKRIRMPNIDINFSKDSLNEKNEIFGRYQKPDTAVCHFPYMGVYFDCDGNQIVCCSDPRSTLKISHIDDIKSFKQMWNGKIIREYRLLLSTNKNAKEICNFCAGNNLLHR